MLRTPAPLTGDVRRHEAVPTHDSPAEHYVDFHDSVLSSVLSGEAGTVVELGPAYIQKWERTGQCIKGTGWFQPLTIRIKNPVISLMPADMPLKVWEGEILINGTLQKGLPRVEARISGHITLRLVLVSDSKLEISGTELEMQLHGFARYAEDLPKEFEPPNGAA